MSLGRIPIAPQHLSVMPSTTPHSRTTTGTRGSDALRFMRRDSAA